MSSSPQHLNMSFSQSRPLENRQNLHFFAESPEERECRIERLFQTLDSSKTGSLDSESLLESFREQYNPLPSSEESVENLASTISPNNPNQLSYTDFKNYIFNIEDNIAISFQKLDRKKDGRLDFDEVRDGLHDLGMDVDDERVELFFNVLDLDGDGYISYDEWIQFLLFVPLVHKNEIPLKAAYEFFIEELELSSDGDFFISSETLNGIGYFLAGGLAGVVSRTCTAPFDRLKVYLIASSGQPLKQTAKTAGTSLKTTVTEAAAESVKSAAKKEPGPLVRAFKHLWSQGGIRAFFVGNGLNIVKVFPESAMKFGTFEAAKRLFARIEGVQDTSEISRFATFISGGMGGVVAQFTVYPIDTLKFRIQCEAQFSKLRGNQLLFETASQMFKTGGIRMFYRGLLVGVCGIFPFAALDLGTFAAMKRALIAREATKLGIDPSEVRLGNLTVLSMGAMSGCVGASVVYPINLLRTRLQAQGTHAHPYTYTGFGDVYRKTVARDGYRGLWRGLAPNLAKVAPAVSISYLVYENSKALLNLA